MHTWSSPIGDDYDISISSGDDWDISISSGDD